MLLCVFKEFADIIASENAGLEIRSAKKSKSSQMDRTGTISRMPMIQDLGDTIGEVSGVGRRGW